ncbi:MAG: alkaline phosphatase, partial [Sphingomonas sp.]|nr:alkaline phosphatase [Sphingomonas sp.]
MVEKILAILAGFTIWVISSGGYIGIAVLMAIESACIPLPSEIIMPFAGYLVYKGQMNLYLAATAGAIGCNLGSIIAYEVGKRGGRPLLLRYGKWVLIGAGEIEAADRFFARFGNMAVLIGRLLPAIRSFIAFPAGVARMPLIPFHIYT